MKRAKRSIISIVLAFVLAFSTSAVSAFAIEANNKTTTSANISRAAGEVYEPYDTHYANYTITDTNTTPYKVMGDNGVINIRGRFRQADNPSYSNVKLLVQIRDYNTGALLAEIQPINDNYPDWDTIQIQASVYAGQEIYFYFDVSSVSNPPGPYRMAEVEYDAWLSYY